MPHHDGLYQWTERVAIRFPELTPAQASLLALFSFGMTLARTSGLSKLALQLAQVLSQKTNTVRQRLRELYQPADAKAGHHRTEIDPTCCWAPLLRWITDGWEDRRLVLALDPTHIGNRFVVLAVSVVYQGCAIPVAWHIQKAEEKGSWNDHWQRLLTRIHETLGTDWEVLVLTDRGLESRALFETIVAAHAHPLMRVKAAGTFRPTGWRRHWPMRRFAAAMGCQWQGTGVAYQDEAAFACTLLACWTEGHDEAWLLLTDLGPTVANPAWYAFRAWIEQGFKVIKSGGWQWQKSRVTDPERASRQWVALALATLWLVEVGHEAERLGLPTGSGKGVRTHRLFQVGLAVIVARLVRGEELPRGSFRTQPWPPVTATCDPLTEEQMRTST